MTSEISPTKLSQLPPEMLDFTLLKTTGALTPRLGRLTFPGRKTLLTPTFLGNTSRGAIPHISQDNFRKIAGLNGVYVALEDCTLSLVDTPGTANSYLVIEKHPEKTPPIFQTEQANSLRRFIALPKDSLLVLGARRQPPTPSPAANSNSEIALSTSYGFRQITSEYYAAAARKLQPDIVVALADIPFGQEAVGIKRKDKMSDRTEVWVRDVIAKRKTIGEGEPRYSIFAPILPIDQDLQSWYLEHLIDDMVHEISGVAIYDAFLLDDLPEALHQLPRLSFHIPAGPNELLRHISLGMDIFTIPFISDATDAGIALDFTFPAPQKSDPDSSARQPLGLDMWPAFHAESTLPLTNECTCYACTKHHRAYVQHLLAAKEMLGWVLIQLHNHTILDAFFSGIRTSIDNSTFEQDVAAFEAFYEPSLPEKTGQGPRIRGYQHSGLEQKKVPGKKNPKAFHNFQKDSVLQAMHGQQPNAKPEMRDVIDDEALVGLVGFENAESGEEALEDLKIEDDKS